MKFVEDDDDDDDEGHWFLYQFY